MLFLGTLQIKIENSDRGGLRWWFKHKEGFNDELILAITDKYSNLDICSMSNTIGQVYSDEYPNEEKCQ